MKKHLIAFSLCGIVCAQASTLYNFSYDASNGTLSGQLLGTLQVDNNTILVYSVVDFAQWRGSTLPSLRSVMSYSQAAS